ncbi:hypothetical protein BDZ88DRAFT_450578 [Geranomyces variabilis]|nr:hypothetical protein BDZ88DRAFT_450578 [Geranomyces variabilis]
MKPVTRKETNCSFCWLLLRVVSSGIAGVACFSDDRNLNGNALPPPFYFNVTYSVAELGPGALTVPFNADVWAQRLRAYDKRQAPQSRYINVYNGRLNTSAPYVRRLLKLQYGERLVPADQKHAER